MFPARAWGWAGFICLAIVVLGIINDAPAANQRITKGTALVGNLLATGNVQANGVVKAGTGPTTLTDSAGKVLSASLNTVGVAQGGTALATLTAHAVYVGNAASAPTALTVGATGTLLAGATGADPAFSATPTVTSIEGAHIHHAASLQTVPNGSTTLTVAAGVGYIPVAGTGGATTLGGTPLITNGTTTGQMLVLKGTDSTNTVLVPSTGNVHTAAAATRTLGSKATLTLVWDGATWCETGFAAL